jgi:hypothetical protein
MGRDYTYPASRRDGGEKVLVGYLEIRDVVYTIVCFMHVHACSC